MQPNSTKKTFVCQRCAITFIRYVTKHNENNRFCSWSCRYGVEDEVRFWSKVNVTDTCWVWTAGTSSNGYGTFALSATEGVATHRYAWQLWHGDIPNGMYVCHHCDNKLCVHIDHLFLGTPKDNTQDYIKKGKPWKPNAHITEDIVKEIRNRYAAGGVQYTDLAKDYGVGRAQIGKIIRHEQWSHVK